MDLLLLIVALLSGPAAASPLAGPALPPSIDPPGLPGAAALDVDGLPGAVETYRSGDLPRARAQLQRLVDERRVRGADRVRAWFLLGWISHELGHHQQASAAFYRVRKLEDHPLAEHAAFYEARADLARGHPRTAIAECDQYVERFPEGVFLDECALLIADSHLDLGNLKVAAERYQAFLDEHPDDQRREAIALRTAAALEESGQPERAAERYRRLYVNHRLPTTAVKATEALERLEAVVELPALSDDQLYTRACSLRIAGQFDASYELFCELDERNPGTGDDATALGKRIDSERYDFLWKNRRYKETGDLASRRYHRDPKASGAAQQLYKAVQGYSKAGEWKQAVKHQELGRRDHAKSRRFRNTAERSALLYTANKQYPQARASWEEWMRLSGRARRSRKTKFLAAYTAFKAKQYDVAVEELGKLARGRDLYAIGAKYWRGRAYERQKQWKKARDEFRAIRKDHPDTWYALLLDERDRRKNGTTTPLRNGRWPATDAPREPPPAPRTAPDVTGLLHHGFAPAPAGPPTEPREPVVRDADGRASGRKFDGWSRLAMLQPRPAEPLAPPGRGLTPARVPPTWGPSPHLDLKAADRLWRRFTEDHGEHWPELPTAYELSKVGLGELAGPLLSAVYGEVRDVRRSRRKRNQVSAWRSRGGKGGNPEIARWAAILDLKLRAEDWRQMFAAAGYPASVSAFATESIRFANEDRTTEAGRGAWSLRFPAAFAPHVWRAGWSYDVDPLLLLSIMRAESLYRHDAVSRAGALGLIQVMPATGARVAALMGESAFRVEELLTPEANIRLGAFYLSQLLTRFEGAFPLAVGSYNGGPHNIGRWLKNKVGMPLDEFVEEIAFDESRHYVKKVTGYYVVYASLYTDGQRVTLPDKTPTDDASVIDF